MKITNVKLSNFKSFKNVDITLEGLNIIIGANASGKTNFVNFLKFLRDIPQSDLENAISLQGGVDFITNLNIPDKKTLKGEINVEEIRKFGFVLSFGDKLRKEIVLDPQNYNYSLELKFNRKKNTYNMVEEKIKGEVEIKTLADMDKDEKDQSPKKIAEIGIRTDGDEIDINLEGDDLPFTEEAIMPPFFKKVSDEEKLEKVEQLYVESMLNPPLSFSQFIFDFSRELRDIGFYNFDPRKSKQPILVSGMKVLESDGSNLPIILKNIQNDKEKRIRLIELLKECLPFIENFDIKTLSSDFLLTNIKEKFGGGKSIPASLVSEGTFQIIALLVVLFFENKSIIVIEEPERNIHPFLLSKIIDMMKDVVKRFNKQIIITTHNPEIVRYAGAENIIFVRRNEKGFSEIFKPMENSEIKAFLENDLGLEDLYSQNILEGIHFEL